MEVEEINMDENKSKNSKEASPIAFKLRNGGISLTAWKNKTADGKEILGLSLERGYKDNNGAWKNSKSYNMNDVPKLISVLQCAYNDVMVRKE